MIIYFSATGNSKHVAQQIAAQTHDTAMSIEDFPAGKAPIIDIAPGERLGFVFPVYFLKVCQPMAEFIERAVISAASDTYVYTVATYGTFTGMSARDAEELLASKGVKLRASFSVKMPDTWTPMFDLSDAAKVAQINLAADETLAEVIKQIAFNATGDHSNNHLPRLFSEAYCAIGLPMSTKTKNFTVDADSCTSCGLCTKRCPAQAIKMLDGAPVWEKGSCYACLRCLHCCPKFAIQYGKNTAAHGQYRHP